MMMSQTYICSPLLLDILENIIELIQLLLRVVWFGVNWDHHQVFQHCRRETHKHTLVVHAEYIDFHLSEYTACAPL